MVSLRNATLDDIDALLQLESGFGVDAWNREQFESELTSPYGYYRVACDKQHLIGYCGCMLLFDQADIQTIFVSNEYRRQGIATMLLRDSLDYLKSRNIHEVFLEVSVSNTHAIRLYTKMEFKNIGIRRQYYKTGDDAIIMKKELKP